MGRAALKLRTSIIPSTTTGTKVSSPMKDGLILDDAGKERMIS